MLTLVRHLSEQSILAKPRLDNANKTHFITKYSKYPLDTLLSKAAELAPPHLESETRCLMVSTGRFIPCGRILKSVDEWMTLKASSLTQPDAVEAVDEKPHVIPSCCVLSVDQTELRMKALSRGTGIGSTINDLPLDADAFRANLIDLCKQPKFTEGRTPGLMFTIDWRHPNADIACDIKLRPLIDQALTAMNISLVVPAGELNEFLSSDLGKHASETAAMCGDPGLLIIPSSDSRPRAEQVRQATAPCGELWLDVGEACCLGDLNLANFYDQETQTVDWFGLERASYLGVKYLNSCIDRFDLPDEMMAVVKHKRRVGLGVMGFADLLDLMGLQYSDDESLALARQISSRMKTGADKAGREGGNITTLALPPTGNLSTELHASCSIEPHFSRTDANSKLQAEPLSPRTHIAMLDAWQSNVDGGVSKTVNMAEGSTAKDVMAVWSSVSGTSIKGVTVFVDKCLENATSAKCTNCLEEA